MELSVKFWQQAKSMYLILLHNLTNCITPASVMREQ